MQLPFPYGLASILTVALRGKFDVEARIPFVSYKIIL